MEAVRSLGGMRRLGPAPLLSAVLAVAAASYVAWSTEGVLLPRWLPLTISYRAAWFVLTALLMAVVTVRRHALRPIDALAVLATTAMAVTSVYETGAVPMRDLEIYLRAGERFLEGEVIYLGAPVVGPPADPSELPFLYPPLTLPLFGTFALVPRPIALAVWSLGSLGVVLTGLRLVGVPWRWTAALLLWPPVFQALWAGNVAPIAFGLFAAGPRFAVGLPLSALFKLYNGLTALWLLRERRWQAALGAAALLATLVVAGLPVTGLGRWSEWLAGLGHYGASQDLVTDLYGMALPRYLPGAVALGVAAGVTVAALAPAGAASLGRLGLATVVASPSLFTHGFLFALPAFATLGLPWLLATLAVTGGPAQGLAWWLPVALVVTGWAMPSLRRVVPVDAPDPLGGAEGPWPGRPR